VKFKQRFSELLRRQRAIVQTGESNGWPAILL
jgi:hypothetical protein